MPIKMACPECQKLYTLQDSMAGKRVRCKDCETSFLVKQPRAAETVMAEEDETDERPARSRREETAYEEDRPRRRKPAVVDEDDDDRPRRRKAAEADDDDDEDDDRPRRSKRKSKKKRPQGTPAWVWAAGGGGVLVVIIGVVLVIILNKDGGTPNKPPPVANRPVPMGNPNLKVGPAGAGQHLAIIEEFRVSAEAGVDAIASARDAASAQTAGDRLREEAKKIDALTKRLEASGFPNPADRPQIAQAGQAMKPLMDRAVKESNDIRIRVVDMRLPPQALQSIDEGMKTFGKSMQNFGLAATAKGI